MSEQELRDAFVDGAVWRENFAFDEACEEAWRRWPEPKEEPVSDTTWYQIPSVLPNLSNQADPTVTSTDDSILKRLHAESPPTHKPCPMAHEHKQECGDPDWYFGREPGDVCIRCRCGVAGPYGVGYDAAWAAWDSMPRLGDMQSGTCECEDFAQLYEDYLDAVVAQDETYEKYQQVAKKLADNEESGKALLRKSLADYWAVKGEARQWELRSRLAERLLRREYKRIGRWMKERETEAVG